MPSPGAWICRRPQGRSVEQPIEQRPVDEIPPSSSAGCRPKPDVDPGSARIFGLETVFAPLATVSVCQKGSNDEAATAVAGLQLVTVLHPQPRFLEPVGHTVYPGVVSFGNERFLSSSWSADRLSSVNTRPVVSRQWARRPRSRAGLETARLPRRVRRQGADEPPPRRRDAPEPW